MVFNFYFSCSFVWLWMCGWLQRNAPCEPCRPISRALHANRDKCFQHRLALCLPAISSNICFGKDWIALDFMITYLKCLSRKRPQWRNKVKIKAKGTKELTSFTVNSPISSIKLTKKLYEFCISLFFFDTLFSFKLASFAPLIYAPMKFANFSEFFFAPMNFSIFA